MKGLNRHREHRAAQHRDEGPIFCNAKINKMLDEEIVEQNRVKEFADGSVFVREKVKKQNRTVYRFFSQTEKIN